MSGKKIVSRPMLSALLLASTSLMSAGAAFAQAEEASVEEIVVTAQKREQNLQDVPIVVTVVGRQLLQDTGVRDIKDLMVLTPGLMVVSTANETQSTALIRGVGTAGGNVGLESSVGTVIDGVYRPRVGVALSDLGDLERIEVLKGPQGTLFGKNTSAGVISVLTAKPSFEPGVKAEATFGNFDELGASVLVEGPLVADKLAGSLFVVGRQRDGYYDVVTGKGPRRLRDDSDRDFHSVRGQLLFDGAGFDARLIADMTRRDENCCVAVQLVNGGTLPYVQALAGSGGGILNPPDPYARQAYSNRDTTQRIRDGGVSLEMNKDLDDLIPGATLTSISAYRDWRWVTGSDSDYTNADILYREDDGSTQTRFRQYSQEVRLGGTVGIVDYTVGAFYAHEKLDARVSQLYGTDFQPFLALLFSGGADQNYLASILSQATPGTGSRDVYGQTDDTFAVFTNNAVRLTEALELTVGLRYTWDKKETVARFDNTDDGRLCDAGLTTGSAALIGALCNPFFNSSFIGVTSRQERDEEALSGTIKLSYRWSPELLTYGAYSRGYKSGGYNLDRVAYPYIAAGSPDAALSLRPVADTSFPAEFVDSYELGVKSTLLDRTLHLNGSLFYQEFTDYQLNAFNGFFFSVFPVPQVRSQGVDLDLLYRPNRRLTVQGGLTVADTRYPKSTASLLSLTASTARLPGERLNLAPLYSGSMSVTYEHPVGNGLIVRTNGTVKYNSEYNAGSDLHPLKVQEAYAVLNARIALAQEDGRWAVELWGANLTDTEYMQNAFDTPFQSGSIDAFLGAPRTYGVTLRTQF